MANAGRASFKEIPGQAPDIMRDYDLATLGYEETEYAVEGAAVSYELQGERGEDGRWDTVPAAEAPYRTRFVVRRPIDADRFSGTVVVEWHNVSAGIDAAPDWGFFHRHIAAQGHAWVGVSAQKVGIDGGGFVGGDPPEAAGAGPVQLDWSTRATPGPSTCSPRSASSSASPPTRIPCRASPHANCWRPGSRSRPPAW